MTSTLETMLQRLESAHKGDAVNFIINGEVNGGCVMRTLRRAYNRASLLVHLDRGGGGNVGGATVCMQTLSRAYDIGTVYGEENGGITADVVVPDTILYTPYNDESDDELEWRGGGSDGDEV